MPPEKIFLKNFLRRHRISTCQLWVECCQNESHHWQHQSQLETEKRHHEKPMCQKQVFAPPIFQKKRQLPQRSQPHRAAKKKAKTDPPDHRFHCIRRKNEQRHTCQRCPIRLGKATPGKDFPHEQIAQKAVQNVQRSENQMPRQAPRSEKFVQKPEEKIGDLVHGGKTEAVEKTQQRRTFQPLLQPGEIGDEACLPGLGVKNLDACEQAEKH